MVILTRREYRCGQLYADLFQQYRKDGYFTHDEVMRMGYRPHNNPSFKDVKKKVKYGCLEIGIKCTKKYKNPNGRTLKVWYIYWVQRVAPGEEYHFKNHIYFNN